MVNYPPRNNKPDTFICHASEDKQYVARPLRDALKEIGVNAWLDESEVRVGDSIRRNIDEGLSACRSATVILSKIFFEKYWTQYEMDGIFQRKIPGEIPLFPIRHGITIEEIKSHSPSLADIASLNSSDQTIERIAADIAARISQLSSPVAVPSATPEAIAEAVTAGRAFGVFYVAPGGTPELPAGSEPEPTIPFIHNGPAGWTPMVNNNGELEYIIDGQTLRIRLDWGNHWSGSEYQAAMLVSEGKPLAFTIRPPRGKQIYLESALSRDEIRMFSGQRNPTGWMTFLIQ